MDNNPLEGDQFKHELPDPADDAMARNAANYYDPKFLHQKAQELYSAAALRDGKASGTRQRSTPWTPEEDERLLQAVHEQGNSNWAAVATFVGNGRTKAQCSQRFHRVIDPRISKSNWSKEEEEKLLQVVEQYGNKAWTRVAAQFGNRTDVQCRFKYNHIKKKLNAGTQPTPIPF
ncbi:RNA polymerase II transcription regulator recruiting protein [Trichomonas vaginalis G3]|uniref:RNA polymerase II transcription regulator recruiting protein n=1 Tax=Trichomonas vaginalis (strain ATCC PRA-98 / G3) TaxID=412133 RepID=UPI0021E5E53C|nr:RNA polymerase II transcription regulator recruiting protein [Trichomonas vaginalis G3]KAI5502723.1 RNA polymerase II transcription regulator recruiting protein [Trichomonas vaginalis G3]